MLRTRLDALSAQKANLKSHQERLTESKRPKVRLRVGAKEGIYSAVEEVVFELRAAVSMVLNGAMARVDVAHVAGLEAIKGLASRATELLAEVVMTHDARDSVIGTNYLSFKSAPMQDMRMVMATQKWLKGLLGDAETLGAMVEEVQHLSITQLHVSDQLCKIDQHLNDFDLIVVEETVSPAPLPRSSTWHSIGDQRETTSPITTGTKSRVKLYVGGLQPNHTEGQLRQHFGQYGSVTECCIARDYNTDESKGFGFVTFGEVKAASRALAAGSHLLSNDPVYVRPFKLRTRKEREAEEVAISCSPAK
ncbi:DAZ-associated protein 1 [Taenia solium]|eukprot:TsM_001159000 transcript=TsM_001159000 gene=TsM_001159000